MHPLVGEQLGLAMANRPPRGGGGVPDAQALFHAKLPRAAALEPMRLNPIALATPRVVAEPFRFAGHELAAGTATL